MRLYIDQDAQEDLAAIKERDSASYYALLVFLREIKTAPELLRTLTEDDRWEAGEFMYDVTPFKHLFKRGFDVWRIAVFSPKSKLLPYRVIYAYDRLHFDFHVLALMPREVNYDEDQAFISRLRNAYTRIGIPINRAH